MKTFPFSCLLLPSNHPILVPTLNKPIPGDVPDSYMYVCGPRQSGKSTLLNRILYPDKAEVPKPGTSFECSFARANIRPDRKDLVHIWEMCGPRELTDHAVQGERVFISAQQIATTTVLIVVDLTEPDCLQQARHWVQLVHAKCKAIYDRMNSEGLRTADKLIGRSQTKFLNVDSVPSEEADKVKHTGVAVTIVGAKYDKAARFDTKKLKVRLVGHACTDACMHTIHTRTCIHVNTCTYTYILYIYMQDMNRAFRALAHANGASLAFVGGLGPSEDGYVCIHDTQFVQHFVKF